MRKMLKYIYILEVDCSGISFQSRFRSDIKLTNELLNPDFDDNFENEYDFFEHCVLNHDYYSNDLDLPSSYTVYGEYGCIYKENYILPDKFYHLLKWFDKYQSIYNDAHNPNNNFDDIFKEYKSFDCCRKEMDSIESEAAIIKIEGYYRRGIKSKIEYCNSLLNEILSVISATSLRNFDKQLIKSKISLQTKINDSDSKSDKDILICFSLNVAKEIKLILEELLCFFHPYPDAFKINISEDSLEDTLSYFKRNLIIQSQILHIRNRTYDISLLNPKPISKINNHKCSLSEISIENDINNLKPKKVEEYLDKINESYLISSNPDFAKKKLGAIILLLYSSKLIRSGKKYISFETFKKIVCSYYNKENIKIHPNKIKELALNELDNHSYLYKDFDIDIKRIQELNNS